jgi:VCBS repeat-containing protein
MNTTTKYSRRALIGFVILAVVLTFTVTPMEAHAASTKSSNAYAKSITIRELTPIPKTKEWKEERDIFSKSRAIKLSPKFKKNRYTYSKNIVPTYLSYLYFDKQKIQVKITKSDPNAKIYVKTSAKGKYKYKKGKSYSQTLKFDIGDTKTVWFRIKAPNGAKKTYTVKLHRWVINAKIEKIVKKAVKEVIEPDMTDGEKVIAIMRWIKANIEYDRSVHDDEEDKYGDDDYDEYYGITHGRGVCRHFSAAFTLFMRYLNIPVTEPFGIKFNEFHSWNMVRLDGTWYNLDPTRGPGSALQSDKNWRSNDYKYDSPKGYWYNGKWTKKTIKCPKNHPRRDQLIAGIPDYGERAK